ncbi:hypothetical protein LS68_008165 [Helicobacter sp. MIT 05-5293]|uniref:hypothetical protein n=1 Tax=Helicobacter sp. MIT 05-5293 TaxID=1548149 RepID=UPI00051D8016|nr:hypothetical protein [Helicobacter sp. MIT 05-5293]TLD80183.1 hypothetical protein LS68_008165 [Helicobacter sp. MIT 05-5293]
MRYILIIFPLLFCACSTRTITQEVLIPTICTITPPPKPTYTGDVQKDLKNILIYDEMIQRDLHFCTGNKP